MKPNHKNFCGGNYQDWLEVYLTDKCNGKCIWCVDKDGFRPTDRASTKELLHAIGKSGKKNIILLGGEPTLYPELHTLVKGIKLLNKKVYVTTNGSCLHLWTTTLTKLDGLNISIHHYDLNKNKDITGIKLSKHYIRQHIRATQTRLNCNLIKGYIDNKEEIYKFIEFAKEIGATKVRFSELKNDVNNFVNLTTLFDGEYGLNNDPMINGCHQEVKIDRFHVSFRQMCGLQNPLRPKHDCKLATKRVLYYNGIMYDGWQVGETRMDIQKQVGAILDAYKNHLITLEEMEKRIKITISEHIIEIAPDLDELTKGPKNHAGGCHY